MKEITTESGARSEALATRFDLIPTEALVRLSRIYAEGAARYGDSNYLKGLGDQKFLRERYNHLLNHLFQWALGDRSEDHLAKVLWGTVLLMVAKDCGPMDAVGSVTFPAQILTEETGHGKD